MFTRLNFLEAAGSSTSNHHPSMPPRDPTENCPSPESPEFEQGFTAFIDQINELETFFEAHHIAHAENIVTDSGAIQTFDSVINQFNAALDANSTLSAYIFSFITTDSRDTLAQAKLSALQ